MIFCDVRFREPAELGAVLLGRAIPPVSVGILGRVSEQDAVLLEAEVLLALCFVREQRADAKSCATNTGKSAFSHEKGMEQTGHALFVKSTASSGSSVTMAGSVSASDSGAATGSGSCTAS